MTAPTLIIHCNHTERQNLKLDALGFIRGSYYFKNAQSYFFCSKINIFFFDFPYLRNAKHAILKWYLSDIRLKKLYSYDNHHSVSLHYVILIIQIQITPPTWSFYGLTFDVISQEQAINVAYTNVNLPYHMDLIYMESAPGLQYLLCRQNDKSVVGGTSILVDTFAVAEELKENGLHKDFLRLFSHDS